MTETPDLPKARVGVLGGSGLYTMPGLECLEEIELSTPYGSTSDSLRLGHMNGMDIVFLARHGRHHHLLPGEVPYTANLWAMRKLGVRWLISVSAVGSLQENIRPRDMVVPDQFIDRTHQRPQTFFGDGCVAHVSLADPTCPVLNTLLADAAAACLPSCRQVHRGGTYLCMEGPAFSTRAESALHRSWGCSVIGMTNLTEARLAREAEMAYTSLSMVTDYDCWHSAHADVSVELVIGHLRANAEATEPILSHLIKLLQVKRPASSAHTALADALITPPEVVPVETRRRLDLLTEPYWGGFDEPT